MAGSMPVASRARLESAIANIWKEILGVADVALDDDFFELGGDSLAAVRMLAAVDEVLLAPVDFSTLIDGPTVAALAIAVERARVVPVGGGPAGPPLENGPEAGVPAAGVAGPGMNGVEIASHAPLTFAQERLWFLDQLGGSTEAYNMPLGARISGPLDPDALDRAFADVVARHQALRTTFGLESGRPVQLVAPSLPVSLERVDLRGEPDPAAAAARRVDALISTPLQLDTGPLVRGLLLRTAEDEHILELVFSHIICDGWSHVVVFRDMAALYRSHAAGAESSLPAPRTQYPEYATAHRARLDDHAVEVLVAPWLERLAGAPEVLRLPSDRPRPPIPSYRGRTHRVRLAPETADAIRSFARAARATPFATLLAVYYMLLGRHSGQDDIVVGITTSGRDRPELEDGVGLFVNTVALRADLSGDPSFSTLVERVRETVLWGIGHEQAPFEQIVARMNDAPDLSRHPVFQVFCAHVPLIGAPLPGAEIYDARPSTSRFDLTLFVEEKRDDALELAWEYSTDLFNADTIERLARRYIRLLDGALANPSRPVGALPMLEESEREQPAAAAPGDTYPVACLHELFARHAAETPDAPAVTFEGSTVSYRELNARANQLARRLRELGAGRETLVALYFEPCVEMIVAILAVLKAGSAYVPLDPEYPTDRIAFVLEDTATPLVITTEPLLDGLPPSAATVVCLDRDAAVLEGLSDQDPEPVARPEHLAYVIYTSGSTGRPKGVLVEHRNVARLFAATDSWYSFGPSDVWVLLHSYAFDFSVWEIWGALAHGGRLVISPLWTTRSPEALAQLVSDQGITVLNATPSLFVTAQEDLIKAVPPGGPLRYVIFGGEALAPASLRPWFERYGEDGAVLVNMYGITETTVHVTHRPLTAADCEREGSPIGLPIPDLSLHLLDPHGAPVPVGVAGELYVGGAGVARGYLNRPELTAERFIEHRFGEGRLYRTGDVALRLADGELHFRGRIDDQVKIRGFRIELGEIQAAIRELPGVAETAVFAVDAAPGDTRLVAYVIPSATGAGQTGLREAIFAGLDARLPAYMVPASIMLIERLPLNRNGKTDRKALPAPVWEKETVAGSRAAQTETERTLAAIWRAILGVEKVGAQDNFFNLGGHSLLAARVVTESRERFSVALSVRSLFEAPTLAGFAEQVDAALALATASPTVPGPASLAPGPPQVSATAPGIRSPALAAMFPSASLPAPPERNQRPPDRDPRPPDRDPRPPDRYPLSFPQQQLLLFDSLDPGSVTYNAALAIRVSGALERQLLHSALEQVFERHEALRTVLIWDEATPHQVVLTDWTVDLEVVELPVGADSSGLDRLLRELARRPFHLDSELMLRTTLVRLSPTEHVILFQPHHVAFDAWAVEIFYRDLGELYAAAIEGREPALPELPLQYRDFATRQRQRLSGERLDHELDFWRAQLAGAPTLLKLSTDLRRPAVQTFTGATINVGLDRELAAGVRDLCGSAGVTPYVLLMATLGTLLYRRSGQDDILLGGPMANRDDPDFENLIGFFANTVVVRVRMAGNPEFGELLRGVGESVLASYEHQEVPLELVVDAVRPQRDPGFNPLFQVNFRVRVGAPPILRLAGTETSLLPVDLDLARFDLALELHVSEAGITAEFNYNTALFHRGTIERLASDFESLLRQVLATPGTRLLAFDLPESGAEGPEASPPASPGMSIRGFRRELSGP